MVKLEVKIKGSAVTLKNLSRLPISGSELKKFLYELSQGQVDSTKARVLEGVDVYGKAIKPSRRATKDKGQTLIDRGHMMGALRVVELTKDKARVGFGAVRENLKAFWHQFGTVKMSARRFFGMSKEDIKRVHEQAAAFMKRKVKKL